MPIRPLDGYEMGGHRTSQECCRLVSPRALLSEFPRGGCTSQTCVVRLDRWFKSLPKPMRQPKPIVSRLMFCCDCGIPARTFLAVLDVVRFRSRDNNRVAQWTERKGSME